MGFTEAISSGFANYVNFSGRAVRSEYWYWVLFAIILGLVAGVIDGVLFGFANNFMPIAWLIDLVLLLPSLGLLFRRLHDLDRTAWWLLLLLIPLIGAIVLIVWFCMPGTPGPNRFGPARA